MRFLWESALHLEQNSALKRGIWIEVEAGIYVDLAAILFVFCLTGGGAARDDLRDPEASSGRRVAPRTVGDDCEVARPKMGRKRVIKRVVFWRSIRKLGSYPLNYSDNKEEFYD